MIEEKVEEYQLGAMILYDHEGRMVVSRTHPDATQIYDSADFVNLIRQSTEGEGISELLSYSCENFLAVMKPLTQKVNEETKDRPILFPRPLWVTS